MPNKPIGEGCKIFALCDHGYTYSFEFYSRINGVQATTIAAMVVAYVYVVGPKGEVVIGKRYIFEYLN